MDLTVPKDEQAAALRKMTDRQLFDAFEGVATATKAGEVSGEQWKDWTDILHDECRLHRQHLRGT